jgi:hypothetical protein
MSLKKTLGLLAATIVISTAVLFVGVATSGAQVGQTITSGSHTTASTAKPKKQRIIYHGYVMEYKYPSLKACREYAKHHSGANRWRLYVVRAEYRQIRNVVDKKAGWEHVWNPKWTILIIHFECRGIPHQKNGPDWGLLQINYILHCAKHPDLLLDPNYNIALGSGMFSSPTVNGGIHPWPTHHFVHVIPFAYPVKVSHR